MSAVSATSRFRLPRLAVVGAIARRDFLVARSYRLAFILDVVYGVLELATYCFISRVFGPLGGGALGAAPSYFAFAAVGVVLATVLSATTYAFSGELRNEQLTGTLEALAAQPLTPVELCAGFVSFPLIFASFRAGAYLAVAGVWLHLDVSRVSLIGVVTMLAATALAMAPVGVLAGAIVLVFKRGTLIVSGLTYVMSLLGGALFPISVLPTQLRDVGRVIPLRFVYDGMRAALFEGSRSSTDVFALVGFAFVLSPVALGAFIGALARARQAGTVSEY